jgi:hypothetical protein
MVNKINKKGQDLSIGTLILIVLGIIVLVLLVLGFSIGWSNLWEKINIFGGTSSVGDVVTACNLAITAQDKFTQCQKTWDIKVEGTSTKIYCKHSLVKGSLNSQILGCSIEQNRAIFKNVCESMKGTVGEECTTGTSQITTIESSITPEGTLCCKAS